MRKYLLLLLFPLAPLAHARPLGPGPQEALGVEIQGYDITCNGLSDGSIRLSLTNVTKIVNYQWTGPGGNGTGQLSANNPIDWLNNLPAGNYGIYLIDNAGADTLIQTIISAPPALQGSILLQTNFSGFGVSCADSQDGRLLASAFGGTPPYQFDWSNAEYTPQIDSLAAGNYRVTVTDYNYCTVTVQTTVTAPPPIVNEIHAEGDKCFGQNQGVIEFKNITGGFPPYRIIFQNQITTNVLRWDSLTPGNYFITVVDKAGCVKPEGVVLPLGIEFEAEIGPDSSIYSGDSLLYLPQYNQQVASVLWEPAQFARFTTPTEVVLKPFFSTTFKIIATDTNGCVTRDEVYIRVHRNRNVYIPNVFEPGASLPENRTFSVFGSGGISAVQSLEVFDRFGNRWYEGKELAVNQPGQGWDGTYSGDEAPPGVYLYHIIVRYTDGREEAWTGDVTLLR